MLVVIANDLPPAVRGRMKLWFIEPRPNCFVSGVKDSVAQLVIDFLYAHCPPSSGVLVLKSLRKPPWYEIYSIGDAKNKFVELSGLQLIAIEPLKKY